MNIGIACDKNYLFLYKSMLRSLAENNRHIKDGIDVYFLNSDLSVDELQAFVDWCNSIGINLKRVKIDSDIFPKDIDYDYNQTFKLVMYYRLLLPFVIPEDVDRILYLDGDMIINGSIEELYKTDFKNKMVVAAPDFVLYNCDNLKKSVNLPQDYIYFNAGMLLLNITEIRNKLSVDDIFKCARTIQENMRYGDQDILNVLFHSKVKYVSMPQYNLQLCWHTRTINNSSLKKYDTRIIHFLYKRKPDDYLFANPLKKQFWKYTRMNGYLGQYLLFRVINPITTLLWNLYIKIKHTEKDFEIDYSKFEKLALSERHIDKWD